MATRQDRLIERLESLLGKGCIWIASNLPEKYLTDGAGKKGEPLGIIQPSTVEEIVALLKVAQEEKIPVTPRGGGSGLRGGAIPSKGGLVLSLEKFNKVIDIDKVNYIAKVQPGVITADLQKMVWEKGLYYPINSLGAEISTVGGDVAENVHGLRGVRYGELRDYIRRLDLVLPTGEIAHTGADPMKSVSGYDMNKLFIGSRGTLGVFTEITLKLLPQPEIARTLLASFDHLKEAAITASAIMANLLTPVALEIMDKKFIHYLDEKIREDANTTPTIRGNALLLIEVDGFESSVKHQIEILENLCKNHKAIEILRNLSKDQEQRFWEIRKSWAFTIFLEKSPVLFLSFFIPPADLGKVVESLEILLNQISLSTTLFGHAGEGNLHVTIFFDSNQDRRQIALSARQQILELIQKFGGFYSQEYFIGVPPLSSAFSQGALDSLQEVFSQFKRKIDPSNILNPGKVL